MSIQNEAPQESQEITDELLDKVEKAIGFKLYDWQRQYLKGDEYDKKVAKAHRSGKTSAYILSLLLSDLVLTEESIKALADEENDMGIQNYSRWFYGEVLTYNQQLKEAGIHTCLS